MIVVRFMVRSKPDMAGQVMPARKDVISPSRMLEGVVSLDIGRDLTDPNLFIATEVLEDRASFERQEACFPSSPQPHS
jgi:quinol monooxygenase YgiN